MPAVVLGKPSPRAASPSPNGETEAHRREATWSGLGRPHVVLLPSALDSLRPDSRAGGGRARGVPPFRALLGPGQRAGAARTPAWQGAVGLSSGRAA